MERPSTSPHCEENGMAVPQWLHGFLNSPYFSPCPQHAALHRSERNFFCIDCDCGSLCSICVARGHAGHTLLQVRKSSYHDAVRVNDVGRLLDLAGIQVYVINGAKIVFLNGRPQARPMKGAPFHCDTCQRALLDNCSFCSIACKLVAEPGDLSPGGGRPAASEARAHRRAGLAVSEDSLDSAEGLRPRKVRHVALSRLPALVPEDHDDASSGDSMDGRRGEFGQGQGRGKKARHFDADEVSSFPPLLEDFQPGTPSRNAVFSWRTHKRKGVPHRAPLA